MADQPVVYVVDDDPQALRAMRWILEQAGHQVRCFGHPTDFLAAYAPDDPGCLVLDLRLPEMDGVQFVESLVARGIALPVIMVSGEADVRSCTRAFRLGILNFLEKPFEPSALLASVDEALRHQQAATGEKAVAAPFSFSASFTPREKEILDLLLVGKSLKQIAALCEITVQTAWKHRASIFRKTGVQNEVELVRKVLGSSVTNASQV